MTRRSRVSGRVVGSSTRGGRRRVLHLRSTESWRTACDKQVRRDRIGGVMRWNVAESAAEATCRECIAAGGLELAQAAREEVA